MSQCNPNKSRLNGIATCPANGKSYKEVARTTVLHHICKPWSKPLNDQRYFFCTDTKCDVVYFGEDNSQIVRDQLREPVGQKSTQAQRIICYCFDISLADIQQSPKKCKNFVVEQTRNSQCDCAVRNPSGKCCLKDFPKEH